MWNQPQSQRIPVCGAVGTEPQQCREPSVGVIECPGVVQAEAYA
ncbi:Uncharacterised protein [Mycobacterium tuberculosis]|nr:Uncharacterised protein [Mycobacterium tuberculosis]